MIPNRRSWPDSDFQQRLLKARVELRQAQAALIAGGELARRRFEKARAALATLEATERMKRALSRRR